MSACVIGKNIFQKYLFDQEETSCDDCNDFNVVNQHILNFDSFCKYLYNIYTTFINTFNAIFITFTTESHCFTKHNINHGTYFNIG